MSEFLVVRLPETTGDASWVVLDAAGHKVSQVEQGPLESATALAENRRVMLLVNGVSVITTAASVPVKGRTQLLKMLPYTLEDAVADDVERFLFCPGARSEQGDIAVSIVEREKLDGWLERCTEAGFAPSLVYADTDGVPETPGNLTLIVEGNRVYGRMPGQSPFVLEDFGLSGVLDLLLPDDDDDIAGLHVVVYANESGRASCSAEVDELRLKVAGLDLHVHPEGPLPRFGATLINQPGSNLRQGSYAPKSNWSGMLRPWRLAAALLLAVGVLATVAEGARYFFLSRQDSVITAQLEAACRSAFQTSQLVACRDQIQRTLAAVGAAPSANSGPVLLQALQAVAEAGGVSGRLEAVSFRNGVTDLRLVVPDVPTLDSMRVSMQRSGQFRVNIQSATPGSDGVEGRLQVVETQP